MFAISMTNTDTNSSPYYDYQHDALYVGDDSGVLHKFSPVFNGAPAAVGSPWPVTVDAPDNLTGPVYDITSTNVYVGDSSGFMNQVNSTTGALVHSGRLGDGAGTATINTEPSGGDTITVGATVYTWHGTCTVAPCIVHTLSTTTDASNLAEAINDTCGSAANCIVSAANASATATSATNVTTIQNTTLGNVAFAESTTASITLSPATLGIAVGMVDAPIVDPSAETVYSFVARDATTTTAAGVRLLPITSNTISSGSVGSMATIGTSSQTTPIYSGTFDNKYFTAASAVSPSGNLYVCGDPGGPHSLWGSHCL